MEWKRLPKWLNPRMIIETLKGYSEVAFLDSSDRINPYGRYSFVAFDPFLHIIYKNGKVFFNWKDGNRTSQTGLWGTLRDLLTTYQVYDPFNTELPAGAAIGYLSYDLGMELECVKSIAKPGLGWPLMEFAFYDLLFCFSRQGGPNWIVSTGLPFLDPVGRQRRAKDRLNEVLFKLKNWGTVWKKTGEKDRSDEIRFDCELKSNFNRQSYLESIKKVREYIAAGDVYQVNLSQSFTGLLDIDGWLVYQYIREFNRVPFGAYLRFGDREILCFSMERFLRMHGRSVETRPIKGTRPRGRSKAEDLRLRRELMDSRKDQAELIMIVDMERNDLGKVCKPGSVRVKKLFEIEQYATVFHLVSTIIGELDDDVEQINCIRACLPGGSITGAPKIRAMEIIDELEGIKREVYCGAIGYFGFNQISDFNIPIRTIQKEGKRIRFNAGGGILYDSDPELEYQETLHKVRSFIECLSANGFNMA